MDELSLIDHNEIMARLTLKQEVSASQVSMLQSGCDEEGLQGACNLEGVQQKDPSELMTLQVAAWAAGSMHLLRPG